MRSVSLTNANAMKEAENKYQDSVINVLKHADQLCYVETKGNSGLILPTWVQYSMRYVEEKQSKRTKTWVWVDTQFWKFPNVTKNLKSIMQGSLRVLYYSKLPWKIMLKLKYSSNFVGANRKGKDLKTGGLVGRLYWMHTHTCRHTHTHTHNVYALQDLSLFCPWYGALHNNSCIMHV